MRFCEKVKKWLWGESVEPVAIPSISIDALEQIKKERLNDAKSASLPNHIVCKGIDLRPNDIIIHNYSRFIITEYFEGFGAGNEFGEFIAIVGYYCCDTERQNKQNFWTFQKSPVIKLI